MTTIPSPLRLALLTLATASLTGCGKKETAPVAPAKPEGVTLVAPAARSKAFEATVAHLDMGGPVFAFVDTEGDPKRVADAILGFWSMASQQDASVPKAPATLDPFLTDLGFANIHATGFSSRIDGKGFINRSFLYTPGGPSGLLAIAGSKNTKFTGPVVAPADTLMFAEGEFDGAKLIAVVRAIASHIGDGKQASAMLETLLTQPLPNAPLNGDTLVKHLSGHMFAGIRVSTTETVPTPKGPVPVTDLTLALDDREPLFQLLSGFALRTGENGPVVIKQEGDFTLITTKAPTPKPFAHYAPVIALQKSTKRVWISTSRTEFDAWTNPAGAKLATAPAFARASSGLATEGNGLAYISPEAAEPVRRLAAGLLANMPDTDAKQRRTVINAVDAGIDALFPAGGPGFYSASFVTPDGLATESRAPISTKPNAYMWMSNSGGGVVVMGGLGAALAIPAFKKVRNNAIEKTLLNDARQLSSAANQYWSEHAATACTLGDLLGPTGYITTLSNGTRIGVISPASENPSFASLLDPANPAARRIKLTTGTRLILGNAQYDRTVTSNAGIQGTTGDTHTLSFDMETGQLAR